MKIRILGFGVLIGILLCSMVVNAEEYDRKGEEHPLAMERMYSVPHKIYGRKKNRNRIRRVYGKFQLPPDAKVGDIIKTKRGYKQITGIYENGRFRMKNLEKKHTEKRKTKEKRDIIRKQEKKRDKYRYKTNYQEIKNF